MSNKIYYKKAVITNEYKEYLKSLKKQGINQIHKMCSFKPITKLLM